MEMIKTLGNNRWGYGVFVFTQKLGEIKQFLTNWIQLTVTIFKDLTGKELVELQLISNLNWIKYICNSLNRKQIINTPTWPMPKTDPFYLMSSWKKVPYKYN